MGFFVDFMTGTCRWFTFSDCRIGYYRDGLSFLVFVLCRGTS